MAEIPRGRAGTAYKCRASPAGRGLEDLVYEGVGGLRLALFCLEGRCHRRLLQPRRHLSLSKHENRINRLHTFTTRAMPSVGRSEQCLVPRQPHAADLPLPVLLYLAFQLVYSAQFR